MLRRCLYVLTLTLLACPPPTAEPESTSVTVSQPDGTPPAARPDDPNRPPPSGGDGGLGEASPPSEPGSPSDMAGQPDGTHPAEDVDEGERPPPTGGPGGLGEASPPGEERPPDAPPPAPDGNSEVNADQPCGDGVCDEPETQDPTLCPRDCQERPTTGDDWCGDGICDALEADQGSCPDDCLGASFDLNQDGGPNTIVPDAEAPIAPSDIPEMPTLPSPEDPAGGN